MVEFEFKEKKGEVEILLLTSMIWAIRFQVFAVAEVKKRNYDR